MRGWIWDWRWGTALERGLRDVRVRGSVEGGEGGGGRGAGRDLRGLWVSREGLQVSSPGQEKDPGDPRALKGLRAAGLGVFTGGLGTLCVLPSVPGKRIVPTRVTLGPAGDL